MNIKKELNLEALKKVAGGWTYDTISKEDLDRYNALQEAWEDAEMKQEYDLQPAIEAQINRFIDEMNAKYN